MILYDRNSNIRFSLMLQIITLGSAIFLYKEQGPKMLGFVLVAASIFWIGVALCHFLKLNDKYPLFSSYWLRFGYAVLFFIISFSFYFIFENKTTTSEIVEPNTRTIIKPTVILPENK